MTTIELFGNERLYGDYRGPATCRSRVVIEREGDTINVFVADGDAGGRGAESRWANHSMTFEQARAMVEVMAPILYGDITDQVLVEMFRVERILPNGVLTTYCVRVGREDGQALVDALNANPERPGERYTMTRIDAWEIQGLINDLLQRSF